MLLLLFFLVIWNGVGMGISEANISKPLKIKGSKGGEKRRFSGWYQKWKGEMSEHLKTMTKIETETTLRSGPTWAHVFKNYDPVWGDAMLQRDYHPESHILLYSQSYKQLNVRGRQNQNYS